MSEQLWSEDDLLDNDTLHVHVVETTDAITGKTIFIAMGDDETRIIGRGETCEDAVVDLENKLFEEVELMDFDDYFDELELAS
ncbi:MAG: hypothetical protein CFH43_00589 [Proteobacteria bacterium]|nr:MAG: hypothetical protein CFH43_00589 [Pseudomonadota bacterium]